MVGIRIPGYELRDLVAAADRENDDRIDLEEFKDVRSFFTVYLTPFSHLRSVQSHYLDFPFTLDTDCMSCFLLRCVLAASIKRMLYIVYCVYF